MKRLEDIARARLVAQRLAGNPAESAVDVVRWLGAVQAQERAIARWSVAQRTDGLRVADVDRALAAGVIVRTHALRPTWHYVAAADLRWVMAATAHRVHQLNGFVYRTTEIDDAVVRKSRSVFEKALARDGALTRVELAERLAAAKIQADGLRLGYLLMRAELDLVICGGPPRGKQHTYALADERVPMSVAVGRDEAVAELATRFFRSHGPATLKDFTWWSSLTMAEARRAVAAARLVGVQAHGRTWYSSADAPPIRRKRGPLVHLVQGYDEIVVAYSESKDVYGRKAGVAPKPGARPPFLHAVLMDGRVIGHWRPVETAKAVEIEMQLKVKLDAGQTRGLRAAVGRYGAFLGKEMRLSPSPRTSSGPPPRPPRSAPRAPSRSP